MKYFIFSCLLFIFLTSPVLAYSCPFGRVDDPFPGSCILYIDQNEDNLCDNSQNIPGLEGSIRDDFTNYYIWQIIVIFIIFQLFGISLIEYEKLSKRLWRKINNYGLLISFIIVFITSLILMANLSGIIYSDNLRFINWLHTESGLIMVLFSVEHLIRRWRYFIVKFK